MYGRPEGPYLATPYFLLPLYCFLAAFFLHRFIFSLQILLLLLLVVVVVVVVAVVVVNWDSLHARLNNH